MPVKALGMTGLALPGGLPDLPTFTEQGFPGFELAGYVAVYVPAGTPRPVIDRLYKAFVAAIRTPEVTQRLVRSWARTRSQARRKNWPRSTSATHRNGSH